MNTFFKLKENKTTVSTEIMAGVTTFFAMSYILFVNPSILSETGMPFQAVFLATIIASIIGTLIMGLFANVPYAQAPGMGLNAFFTFTVVFGMGYTWQQALAMVFICGLINILITVTKIRKMIIKAIPESLQHAIGGGIGIFVAYVGLKNAGLLSFTVQAEPQNGVVNGSSIVPALGNFDNPAIIVILFITTLLTIFLVKEDFQPVEKKDLLTTKEIFSKMDHVSVLIGLFVTTLILQLGITSISPILTLYIRSLSGDTENVLFVSGLIVSIAGVSAIISSPTLGKIGDRIGNQKVLLGGLILSFICYIPMAFVQTPFQLGVLRFLLGFSTGALMPSINTLISKITPTEGVSRVYSYNQMCSNFGQVLGPMVGSTVAHGFGYSSVFLVTACFVLGNIGLSFFNFRKVLNKKL